jgi:purine-binding chemotaxis protein CheW
MTTGKAKYCTFFVGDQFFGVEVEKVQEIIRYQEMTQVPLSEKTIGGLLSLRGQIVIAIDLRERLGFPIRPGGQLPMNVLVRSENGVESLLVDDIGDVVEVDADTFEFPPCTLQGIAREMVRGIYKLHGHLLLILDVHQVVNLGTSQPSEFATASCKG